MNEQNVLAALANGQQKMVPVDAGACGAGGAMAGYPGYGYGDCASPGVTPTFSGFVSPGVYKSCKVVGAQGVVAADGRVFRCLPGSTYVAMNAALPVDINGAVQTINWPGGFIPTIDEVGQGGVVLFTLDGEGYATVNGWNWTATDGIQIKSAKAQGGFVETVDDVAADTFNIDGCACPIAFSCFTDKHAIELVLGLGCRDQLLQDDAFLTLIEGETPVQNTDAFLLDAKVFAFALYVTVYEALGACGTVGPLYNLAPNATPMLPAPPQGPCGPAAMQAGPAYAQPGAGYPNGGYMQPGMMG